MMYFTDSIQIWGEYLSLNPDCNRFSKKIPIMVLHLDFLNKKTAKWALHKKKPENF